MPDVVGLSEADAEAALLELELTAALSPEFDSLVPLGQVVSTAPVAGTAVAPESSVTVVVSQGPDCDTLVGTDGTTAAERLTTAGYTVTSTDEPSSTVADGNVIRCSQQPSAGTAIVTVSTGPDACSEIIGGTRAAAVAALEGLGLTVNVDERFHESAPAGDVVDCSEAGGAATIVVSKGPFPADCDAVVGMTELAARSELTDLGFPTINTEQASSDTVEAGRVIGCAVSGSVAVITVSSGPGPDRGARRDRSHHGGRGVRRTGGGRVPPGPAG